MAVLQGILWAVACAAAAVYAQRRYLPVLAEKQRSEEDAGPRALSPDDRSKSGVALLSVSIFALVAFACGMASGLRGDLPVNASKMLLALAVLGVTAMTDARLYTIPNRCVAILLIGRVVTMLWELGFHREVVPSGWINSLVAGGACAVFLLIAGRVSRGGIGSGDVKLFAALGFLCGIRALIYTLVFAFFLCAGVAAFLLVTHRKKAWDGLPMAPFIWVGFAAAVFLGLC